MPTATESHLKEIGVRPFTNEDAKAVSEGDRLYRVHAGDLVVGYTVSKITRAHHDGSDGWGQQSWEHVSVGLEGDAPSTWGYHYSINEDGSFKECWVPDLLIESDEPTRTVRVAEPAYHVVTVKVRVPITEGSVEPDTHIAAVEGTLIKEGFDVALGSSAQVATGLRVNVYRREYDYTPVPVTQRGGRPRKEPRFEPPKEILRPVAVAVRSEEAFAFCTGNASEYVFENVDDSLVVGR